MSSCTVSRNCLPVISCPTERIVVVLVRPRKLRQPHRQLIMVLQRVNQATRVDLILAHELEDQPQKLRISCQQRMLIRRTRHKVISEVRAAVGHLVDLVERERQLLEGKSAHLAHRVAQ